MLLRGLMLVAAAAGVAAGADAPAHSEDQEERSALLDCEHLPGAAVTSLPEPFDRLARLECRPNGQLLVQGEGWIWRYPGSFTTQVFLPAWTAAPSTSAERARYFTAATVSVERGADAAELHRRFIAEVSLYSARAGRDDGALPREVYSLTALNDLGQALQLHLVQSPNRADVWGIVCVPDCRSEYSFLATSRESR